MINMKAGARWSCVLVLVLVCLLLALGTAWGHGEVVSRTPPAGKVLRKAPRHVYVTFTEAPSREARMRVVDGCGNNVVKRLERIETTLHVDVAKGGAPGRWRVTYDIISDEDGHKTEGGYSFRVRGDAGGCQEGNGSGPSDAAHYGGGASLPPEDSGFPLIPVVAGGVALVGLALVARVLQAR